ncbi:hypothetical protein HTZ84_09370 [Haloterrigena sp. SYSU A558-1]|uniref:Uncharacterized protein n=1 Tax=Haloterrigena gelatinilytica TaxID=2741724 RepID=A0ABX2LBH0_9EURY|nr:hypothetical protein [Haloterrigena gelatinilytica]NUC72514.1 hypothetical protein [Haloterrigena gelatinilytica]
MQRGIIGLVNGDFSSLDTFRETTEQNGFKLKRGIDIVRSGTLSNGQPVLIGRAGIEEVITKDEISINESRIGFKETSETSTKYTEFVAIPGDFVVVDSGSGSFAFDLIGRQADCLISRAEIDLQQFYAAMRDYNPNVWKLGFKGLGSQTQNGVVYGNDVTSDGGFGETLDETDKNQLGLSYTSEGDGIKMMITQSGYIEIYTPSNYEPEEFAEYIASKAIPHAEAKN